jgi:hypothetical protein
MRNYLNAAAIAVLVAVAGNAQSRADAAGRASPRSVDAVLDRHMAAFLQHDWDKVIQDYSDDAVFILPDGPIEGKPAILAFFHSLDVPKPAPVFKVSRVKSAGHVGLEDWVMNPGQPGSVKGRDVFVIRNGKITAQTTIGFGPAGP